MNSILPIHSVDVRVSFIYKKNFPIFLYIPSLAIFTLFTLTIRIYIYITHKHAYIQYTYINIYIIENSVEKPKTWALIFTFLHFQENFHWSRKVLCVIPFTLFIYVYKTKFYIFNSIQYIYIYTVYTRCIKFSPQLSLFIPPHTFILLNPTNLLAWYGAVRIYMVENRIRYLHIFMDICFLYRILRYIGKVNI